MPGRLTPVPTLIMLVILAVAGIIVSIYSALRYGTKNTFKDWGEIMRLFFKAIKGLFKR
jgi:hypothetical protein